MSLQTQETFQTYASLLSELGVTSPTHQDQVFQILLTFRNRPVYLRSVRTGTTRAHAFLNRDVFGAGNIRRLAQIEGLSGPLKDVSDPDKKAEALDLAKPIMSRLWAEMRRTLFEQPVAQQHDQETYEAALTLLSLRVPRPAVPVGPPAAAPPTAWDHLLAAAAEARDRWYAERDGEEE